jgi:Bifunctional DNA primase/polymerase, N-terminal
MAHSDLLREYGRRYIDRGWRVFVLSGKKHPLGNCERCSSRSAGFVAHSAEECECLTCHGFYAATLDARRLDRMIKRSPKGCLAVRTGAASGLAVVDIDIHAETDPKDVGRVTAYQMWRAGLLPDTQTAQTGGGGFHMLYAHPGGKLQTGAHKAGSITGTKQNFVDSKADGGYIVVPPSVHPDTGRSYEWLTERGELPPLESRLAGWLRKAEPARHLRAVSPGERIVTPESFRSELVGLVTTVLNAGEGERNGVLNWAAHRAGQKLQGLPSATDGVVASLQEAARMIGLDESEIGDAVGGTIGSGIRSGLVTPVEEYNRSLASARADFA